MNLFNISVSSVTAGYSADFQSTSATYITNIGNYTSDGTFFANVTGPYAPYTAVKLTPLNLGSGLWANSLSAIRFYFLDVFSPSAVQTTVPAFSSTGVTHIYGPPNKYYIAMTAHPTLTSKPASAFAIASVEVGEIAARPSISVFELDGSSATLGTSAYSPHTYMFAATATRPGSYPTEAIIWNFGDDSEPVLVQEGVDLTNFIQLTATDGNDPRRYVVSHTFTRNLSTNPSTFSPKLSTQSMITATRAVTGTPLTVGPLQLAAPEPRRLVKGKLYGPANDFLLISETDGGQVFQHSIKGLI